MRTAITGSLSVLPRDYVYSMRMEHAPRYPALSSAFVGNYADNYFDLGAERRISFGIAPSSNEVVWVWSPNTFMGDGYPDKGAVTRGLRVGRFDGISCTENEHAYYIEYGTRPDVGPNGIVATIEGGNLVIRSVANGIFTHIQTTPHGVSVTDGLSVSVVSQNDVWLGWIENNVHRAKRFNGSVWGATVNLCAHRSLLPWHATGFRVLSYDGGHLFFFSATAKSAVCRQYRGGILSEKIPLVGADSEYAFQHAVVTGATLVNGSPFVTLQRHIENSDGESSSSYASIAYARNPEQWTDWCGVRAGIFRGGMAVLNDTVVVGSVSHVMTSPGTSVTGNAVWTPMNNITTWNYDSRLDTAASGNTRFIGQDSLPLQGYDLRRYLSVNGAEFLYSTESVDTCQSTRKSSGYAGTITSRGPMKHGIAYLSSVDEVFTSGGATLVDFAFHSLVAKQGVWSHSAENRRMSVSNDNGLIALAILPEPIYDSFWYAASSPALSVDAGPAFWVEDENNYWRLRYTGTDHLVEQVLSGTATVKGSFSTLPGEACYLLHLHDGALDIYVSTPDVPSSAGNYLSHLQWLHVLSLAMPAGPVKSYVGYTGKSGASVRMLHLRKSGIEQTIGTVCSSIAGRSGVDLHILEQIAEDGNWKTTTSPLFYEQLLEGYDLTFRVDTNNSYLGVAVGGRRINGSSSVVTEDWPAYLRIDNDRLSLYVSTWNGSAYVWSLHSSINLLQTLAVDDELRVRIARTENFKYAILNVYRNLRLLWSIPLPFVIDSGQLSFFGGGKLRSLTAASLNQYIGTHIWQYARPGIDEIKSLIRPLFWSLFERSNGTVLLAPTEYVDGDTGSVDATSLVVDHIPDDTEWRSIFKVVGAEVYGVYVDPELIVRGPRPVEFSSPYLWTEEECLKHAFRMSAHSRSLMDRKNISGFADPRIEVGDKINIGGNDYLVTGYSVNVVSPRNPEALALVEARRIQ